jgi:hypothetical protein
LGEIELRKNKFPMNFEGNASGGEKWEKGRKVSGHKVNREVDGKHAVICG